MDIIPPFGKVDGRSLDRPESALGGSASMPLAEAVTTRKRRFRMVFWPALILFLVLLIVGAFAFVSVPRNASGASHDFTIRPGESLLDITTDMERDGLISNRYLFAAYLRLHGQTDSIKAGTFSLSSAMSPRQIGNIITAKAPPEKDVSILIPEGFTVVEIAQRLAEKGLIAKPEQLTDATVQVIPYDFLPQCGLSVGASLCRISVASLEGYLFPDTYRFSKKSDMDDVVGRFLDDFDKHLTPDLREEIRAKNKTIKDVVTVASLVEKEAKRDEDRALIAGIIWQRFAINMPLQVDASVLYAKERQLGKPLDDRQLTAEDLKIESSYNTYLHPGLPPEPIANPGVKSLIAAIRPESSQYLYYLHTPDGTTIFSRTLQEHNAAKAKYLR